MALRGFVCLHLYLYCFATLQYSIIRYLTTALHSRCAWTISVAYSCGCFCCRQPHSCIEDFRCMVAYNLSFLSHSCSTSFQTLATVPVVTTHRSANASFGCAARGSSASWQPAACTRTRSSESQNTLAHQRQIIFCHPSSVSRVKTRYCVAL